MKQWYYYPDYHKLYPDVKISDEVMAVLRKSDRKMRYMEWELKKSREIVAKASEGKEAENRNVRKVRPAREYYFEQVQEELDAIAMSRTDLESQTIHMEQLHILNVALGSLSEEESSLIYALFYQGVSLREYARRTGAPVMTVQNRKNRILRKLKKYIEAKNNLVQGPCITPHLNEGERKVLPKMTPEPPETGDGRKQHSVCADLEN